MEVKEGGGLKFLERFLNSAGMGNAKLDIQGFKRLEYVFLDGDNVTV